MTGRDQRAGTTEEPRTLPFGDGAVLVELPDLAAVHALDAAIRELRDPRVVDRVPGARTLVLRGPDPDALGELVARAWALRSPDAVAAAQDPVVLEVTYDGDDLDGVAGLTGLSVQEVVGRHLAAQYTVAFGGFMPGFAYLTGLDPLLRVPRLESPRQKVPPGSVAIADEFTAVYPAATPGGWRLLGRCGAQLFDVQREPPALLSAGMRVRFVRAP
jgi:KipI family sensor histidine kinase inhibitor